MEYVEHSSVDLDSRTPKRPSLLVVWFMVFTVVIIELELVLSVPDKPSTNRRQLNADPYPLSNEKNDNSICHFDWERMACSEGCCIQTHSRIGVEPSLCEACHDSSISTLVGSNPLVLRFNVFGENGSTNVAPDIDTTNKGSSTPVSTDSGKEYNNEDIQNEKSLANGDMVDQVVDQNQNNSKSKTDQLLRGYEFKRISDADEYTEKETGNEEATYAEQNYNGEDTYLAQDDFPTVANSDPDADAGVSDDLNVLSSEWNVDTNSISADGINRRSSKHHSKASRKRYYDYQSKTNGTKGELLYSRKSSYIKRGQKGSEFDIEVPNNGTKANDYSNKPQARAIFKRIRKDSNKTRTRPKKYSINMDDFGDLP
uniref:Uncharacterized protein n=1 Tax=Aplanochytrium stocchinoi TaxID=215587 RepID=A0A7S3PQ19_9STRA|mmetsp:Transcript_1757/g.2335  ORF Transcript_1757/g.2335 Transcript_1757/m.2335 type:complete len:370 (+) Transcript_1757:83-1192(+)|eukprot:CAMPEP_0204822620 /NCGR_PEP_ID=MMETSP1346-20131115/812_1 /ASSEMBLY_ACC=CAM_ASM_000771 /TAXON_ID=215587 /ORGANISM="Aplanochytrium stocchinoi, Strain GSBS06" /LENGTH=369 /DNA_ID=CAMNT_0051948939 /DNA_START=14 /DNA_END=1123 /DNA_ORIENTATION=-